MQLSEIIDQTITLRQKQFIGPHPHHDVQATVLQVKEWQVKCRIGTGTIYIPKKFFFEKRSDLVTRIIWVPTWFSFMTVERLEEIRKNQVVKCAE